MNPPNREIAARPQLNNQGLIPACPPCLHFALLHFLAAKITPFLDRGRIVYILAESFIFVPRSDLLYPLFLRLLTSSSLASTNTIIIYNARNYCRHRGAFLSPLPLPALANGRSRILSWTAGSERRRTMIPKPMSCGLSTSSRRSCTAFP